MTNRPEKPDTYALGKLSDAVLILDDTSKGSLADRIQEASAKWDVIAPSMLRELQWRFLERIISELRASPVWDKADERKDDPQVAHGIKGMPLEKLEELAEDVRRLHRDVKSYYP